jgi:hypothetical protein
LTFARAQAVKIGAVISPQQDGLAVEHGAVDRQRGDSFSDARERAGIIGRGARPKPHAIAVFAGDHPIAVPLHLVHPSGPGRRPVRERGLAGVERVRMGHFESGGFT